MDYHNHQTSHSNAILKYKNPNFIGRWDEFPVETRRHWPGNPRWPSQQKRRWLSGSQNGLFRSRNMGSSLSKHKMVWYIYIYIYNMHEWTSYIIYIYIFIKSEIFQNYGQIQQNVGECSVELGWVTARLSISIWKSSSDRNIYSREISIVTFHFIALGNSSAN